jgi:hypothetical protein
MVDKPVLDSKAGDLPRGAVPVQQSSRTSAAGKSKIGAILTAVASLILAGFGSQISQLNLSPVYGSIPSALLHGRVVTFVALLAYIIKRRVAGQGGKVWDYEKLIAPWMYYTPVLQYVLFQQSEKLGPFWGPFLTEAATFYPILLLTFISSNLVLDDLGLQQFGHHIANGAPAVASFAVFGAAEKAAVKFLPQIMGTYDFCTRLGLQLLNASLAAAISRSTLLVFAIPAMVHTLFNNPHNYALGTSKQLNATLYDYQYAVLERHDSLTGYLSVVKNKRDGFLALRCDHSILGGEWLVTPARLRKGQEVRETIYPVFTMLEAVRLIKTDVYAPDDEKDALFMYVLENASRIITDKSKWSRSGYCSPSVYRSRSERDNR